MKAHVGDPADCPACKESNSKECPECGHALTGEFDEHGRTICEACGEHVWLGVGTYND